MTDPVADALARLVAIVQGGIQMTQRSAISNDIYRTFQDTGTITGTARLTVWDPGATKRFVLRGGIITAIVSTILAAADEGTLFFNDSTGGFTVSPIGAFAAAAAAGTIITGGNGPFSFDLKDGYAGSAVGAVLKIKSSIDLTTGVIAVCGVLWGTEVSN